MAEKDYDDRRLAQRFHLNLPLEIHVGGGRGAGATTVQTRDVSFRGVYFSFNRVLEAGSKIDFVLTLPKEVTLTTDVRVRCAGRVVRVEPVPENGKQGPPAPEPRVGVAAVIEEYEFLPLESSELAHPGG